MKKKKKKKKRKNVLHKTSSTLSASTMIALEVCDLLLDRDAKNMPPLFKKVQVSTTMELPQIPDDLLLHILAKLPLKDAVRCKLLSKGYNHLISSLTFHSFRHCFGRIGNAYIVQKFGRDRDVFAYCPRHNEYICFPVPKVPGWDGGIHGEGICMEASEQGLLCIGFCLQNEGPRRHIVWNPVTGWQRTVPPLEGNNSKVIGMIVKLNGPKSTTFYLFKGDTIKDINDTILYVYDSITEKWSSNVIKDAKAYYLWTFQRCHNQLVAYFIESQAFRLCTFLLGSNQLIKSFQVDQYSIHRIIAGLDRFWIPLQLQVDQNSSVGRKRASLLVQTGWEHPLELWEASEGDEVGMWTDWRWVCALRKHAHYPISGKFLYFVEDTILLLIDNFYRGNLPEEMLDIFYGNAKLWAWTPSTFMCP